MSYGLWFLVILVTFLVAYWFGYWVNHGAAELERVRLLAELDEATNNVQLPRAGRLPNQGAQDPAYQLPVPVPWDLAGAAYVLGQMRADQDDVSRQVDDIFLRIENDAKWRYR